MQQHYKSHLTWWDFFDGVVGNQQLVSLGSSLLIDAVAQADLFKLEAGEDLPNGRHVVNRQQNVRRRQLLPELAVAFAPPPRKKLYQLLHQLIPV